MITDELFNLKSFQRQFDAVLQLSVSVTIPNLVWSTSREELLSKIDWSNLLGIASILCYSQSSDHLDAALRIAQSCLVVSTSEKHKIGATVILENLTNHPAVQLAIKRQMINSDYHDLLSLPLQLQTARTAFENATHVAGNLVRLNKFQKNVFDAYQSYEAISISAPTSAGKSFVLYNIVVDSIHENVRNIVYVVPTRALISQVEEDLRELLKQFELQNVSISTVPQYKHASGSHVFVFTQERLHWFLMEHHSVPIDVLIIDEAQKIADGNRGILLQQKLEEVISLNPEVKIFFSSPFTSNPEVLLSEISNTERQVVVNTQFISVNQNLIYISQVPRKVEEYNLDLMLHHRSINLGTISISDRPGSSELRKLCFLSNAFSGGNSGNLVYSNGAAEAEKLANIFFSLSSEITENKELDELIKLVRRVVHREYLLARVLKKGIAFHYGNMPLIIRQEIERLFKEGLINVLICTSTLLEGVNLPSKTIFIRKPTRGKNKPLTSNDFWNLAGRAGRWGKEFSGNIVCIDPSQWAVPPNTHKSQQTIVRATDVIERNPDEFLNYVQNDSPRKIANTRQDLEFAFGYYYNKFLSNTLEDKEDFYKIVAADFEKVREKVTLPTYLIRRNPGISPIAQQSLYDYFQSKIDTISELIPVYPEDVNALQEYIKLIGRIGKTLSYYPPTLNQSRAILLINWMLGRPLSYIIVSSYNSYQKNDKYKNIKTLPVVIRECMDNIEDFVRFRFAKDSSCYIDILRHFLDVNNLNDLAKNIPDLTLWIEFGVSQQTQLSLLSLGLSRSTVIEISQYIPSSQMDRNAAMIWLSTFDLNSIEISPIIRADIEKVVSIPSQLPNS